MYDSPGKETDPETKNRISYSGNDDRDVFFDRMRRNTREFSCKKVGKYKRNIV